MADQVAFPPLPFLKGTQAASALLSPLKGGQAASPLLSPLKGGQAASPLLPPLGEGWDGGRLVMARYPISPPTQTGQRIFQSSTPRLLPD